jgi:hypothetical protein
MSSPANFLQGVLSTHIDKVWDKVKPLLQKALDYSDGKYGLEDVYRALSQREMQLWLVFDERGEICAICITRVICYPREKRAAIVFASGTGVMEWVHHNETIQAWAKSEGCASLEIYGRPGWEKVLAPYGYQKIHTVLKVNLPSTH